MDASPLTRRLRSHIGTLAWMLCAAGSADAQTVFDAANGFSDSINPGRFWSYRSQEPGKDSVLLPYKHQGGCFGLGTYYCWSPSAGSEGYPHIGEYFEKSAILGAPYPGAPIFQTRVVRMHPSDGLRAVVAFGSPTTETNGSYAVYARLQLVDTDPAGGLTGPIGVTVAVGGSAACTWSGARSVTLTAFGQAQSFIGQCTMAVGQRIEFSVDANGNYTNDSTELTAIVRKLP